MLNDKKKQIFLLGLILLIALLIRIISLNEVSMYGDELTITYDAYSILKTGMDQTGKLYPLTFSMGAGRPAGYVYFTIPFIAIFGPTELGVRALSILSGLGIIVLVYLLTKRLLSIKIALITAFLIAISPWDISLSRGGFEAHFGLFLSLLGIVSFIYSKNKPWLMIFSAISFGLAIHTYPTYKLTLPLVILLLFWFFNSFNQQINKRNLTIFASSSLILIFFAILSFSQTFFSGSENRFLEINILSKEDVRNEILQKVNEERTIASAPTQYIRFFHNETVEYFLLFGKNYFDNLSPDFLFFNGDGNPRHNMANIGGFYIIEILTIFLGLLYIFTINKRLHIFLLLWILISPLATAFIDRPHFLRSALMIPPLAILSATGLSYVFSKRKFFGVFIVLAFAIQFIFFAEKLLLISPNKYSQFWSGSAKLTSNFIIENRNNYDYVIVSDRIDNIEYAYPVYGKIDPKIIIQQNREKTVLFGLNFKKMENVYIGFIPDGDADNFISKLGSKVLYIGTQNDQKFLQGYRSILGKDLHTAFVYKESN